MGKTTIQISHQTKAELDNIKKGDVESYDHTIQRIIRAYDGDPDGLTESRVREIVREETEEVIKGYACEDCDFTGSLNEALSHYEERHGGDGVDDGVTPIHEQRPKAEVYGSE